MKNNKIACKITIPLLSLLILVYSTVLQFSLPSVVLCLGSDGHIAFEQSDDNCRFVDSGAHRNHLADDHKNLSHQDEDCDDIPLVKLFSLPFVEKDGTSKQARLPAANTGGMNTDVLSIAQFDINSGSKIILPTIKNLRTTILLI